MDGRKHILCIVGGGGVGGEIGVLFYYHFFMCTSEVSLVWKYTDLLFSSLCGLFKYFFFHGDLMDMVRILPIPLNPVTFFFFFCICFYCVILLDGRFGKGAGRTHEAYRYH